MPFTDAGARRLADELARAADVVRPPALVWVFDRDLLAEVRGVLYGWQAAHPRHGLVVRHEPGLFDRVEWVCEPFLRPRHE